MRHILRSISALLFLAVFCAAQELPPLQAQEPSPGQEPAATAERQERPGMPTPPSTDPKPYDKVITKDAKTRPGIFTVHVVKDKWYYEIPKSELNKDFLWVMQISQATLGVDRGGGAFRSRVVRWQRRDNKILLRDIKYDMVANPGDPIAREVAAHNHDSILMAFPVAAWGKDDAAVIDVTRLFTSDSVVEISAKNLIRTGSLDASRSFIERLTPFPTNIEAESTLTYSTPIPPPSASAMPSPAAAASRPGTASFVIHFSMVKLPEKIMMPRVADDRVGFFTDSRTDYSRDDQKVRPRVYITRWRLEKKDPAAAVSDPVKPIEYYVDPATPKKWVPYVKAGIEAWQPAFEGAGFRKAIVAREVPSPEQDPDFSTEDARYSIVKWIPSTIENAMGPHIADPRSGEILNAPISMWHNIINLQRAWYFLQVGPLDPRAQKLPLPDDLMGKLIEYVVAHEVGHTLGLQHNMLASSTYPQEKVRDPEWVHKMGHTPSIMDYSRFNYVAQPEDHIPPADLIPTIGPYDKFAIKWGYTPIVEARTSDDEKPTLDAWATQQESTPWLRFSSPKSYDPGDQTEAVGDADAVKSTALGVKNLERVSRMLLAATSFQPGEKYEDLEEMYGRMLGQWSLEMAHVSRVVGGVYSQNKHVGQKGVLYTPVPAERQRAAVKYLVANVFTAPKFVLDREVLRRIEPVGAISRINRAQRNVLNSLLSAEKLARMQEAEVVDGVAAYSPLQMLADVRKGVWTEIDGAAPVKIDVYRRNLQRSYLDILNQALNVPRPPLPSFPGFTPSPTTEDVRGWYRGELKALNASVAAATARASDRETRLHLEDVKDQIARILDPKFAAASPAGAASPFGRAFDGTGLWFDPYSCFPDYRIEP